ncbi:related to UBX domain-containing protein 7 [Saccharomycodes ludwigii]|uniref:Related to UBX domain-containing protein 7 n=1 Tax=Saccharomycodes ludwigii TaxID=36035 RepID=A0A376B198_9ASCO|nr:hypothetical protein SCDLUD_003575 [Saccharomycodes ludwigii]KAH3900583.1 hypothetical protein SCDLUD_003575 [Saccharomycodes ludwigii]SSD58437.1 related to UBX domain-containing protein 7 [Saccharomycodes ludwigii]
MERLHYLFETSVETAVKKSLESNKPLIVYSTDDNDDQWLLSWLNEDLLDLIAKDSILLKLFKDSVQFGYFQQIAPNVTVPSVCCIFGGNITEVLLKDQDGLGERLRKCINTIKDTQAVQSPNTATSATVGTDVNQSPPVDTRINRSLQQSTSITPDGIVEPEILNDSIKPSNQSTTSSSAPIAQLSNEEKKYRQKVINEQNKIKEEKLRIKRLLKQDKEERESYEREMLRSNNMNKNGEGENAPVEVKDKIKGSAVHKEKCALLLRLTNGNTLTHEFNSQETLNDVRKWVDINRTDGDVPYSFHRNIPRVTFGDADELKSLQALELPPRSALILQPFSIEEKNIAHVQSKNPGLLYKVYRGVSSWWSKDSTEKDLSNDNPNDNISAISNNSNFINDVVDNHQPYDVTHSPASSTYLSPRQSFYSTVNNESQLSVTSGSTPNVYHFLTQNENVNDDERSTYNGNNVNLKDDKAKD